MSKEAESLYKQHKYSEAAKIYLDLAKVTNDNSRKIILFEKAVDAFHQLGACDEESECLLNLSSLLVGGEKLNCLVSAWRVYIMAIAVFQYDSGFEWKGEPENLNVSYDEIIQGYFEKAVAILKTALDQRDVNRKELLEKLGNECAKRQNEGGWGADHCWKTIDKAWH